MAEVKAFHDAISSKAAGRGRAPTRGRHGPPALPALQPRKQRPRRGGGRPLFLAPKPGWSLRLRKVALFFPRRRPTPIIPDGTELFPRRGSECGVAGPFIEPPALPAPGAGAPRCYPAPGPFLKGTPEQGLSACR